ncbi:hypothetical protein FRB96_004623 [Tulasnella sp. 330]|nr:hypothetical protein FRB96_004623 [Tulasnella sp. 330]KAG8879807.1 hypothetical protein FRB97_001377 [Tulasnella sp. 331]KAG8886324.1 hypothetical protein FRB98_001309 [Tulasnella sp. 332]
MALLFTLLEIYWLPIDDLQAVDRGLADLFWALSTSIDEPVLSERAAQTRKVAIEDQVGRWQRLAAGWNRALQETRQLPGFKSFLSAAPFAELRNAATNGPVILVNISQYGSDTIIIHQAREIISIPLPDATPTARYSHALLAKPPVLVLKVEKVTKSRR